MPDRLARPYEQPMARSSKRRRTAAEWTQLLEAWEASGLGAERFARERDVSASSLYVWKKRLAAVGQPPASASVGRGVDFVPMVVEAGAPPEPGGPTRWSLETPSGWSLEMSGPDAVRGLEIALQVLGDGAPG